tara:strand:+ start:1188 stop:1331 length:144 start_codon:yes stop_codon:yes gene_type:complete
MKLTLANLQIVNNYIIEQLQNDNGEFDNETDLLSAVDRTIEMLKEVK